MTQWPLWRRLIPARPNSVGMSPQCLAWCSSGGDGHTGLIVTGTTDPAGLTSRRGPASAQKRRSRVPPAPFEGATCYPMAQCHGADTVLAAQCYTTAGMASPRELVEQCRDAIPGRAKVVMCVLQCQGIKCPYTGAGARVIVRAGALERGGPRPRGCLALKRGGPCPRGR
jgi:hypothetical protein